MNKTSCKLARLDSFSWFLSLCLPHIRPFVSYLILVITFLILMRYGSQSTSEVRQYRCELIGYMLDVFFGRGSTRTRHVNSFETIGSVTAVCALDKDGVLVDVFSTAEHALVVEKGTPLVLDVIQDANAPSGIVFERDLHDHLPSIRPLALACSLNATCNGTNSYFGCFLYIRSCHQDFELCCYSL